MTTAPRPCVSVCALGLVAAVAGCGNPAPAAAPAAPAAAAKAPPPSTAAQAPAPTPKPPRVITASFSSAALGVDKRYVAYLPANYSPQRSVRYPVIYLLHGLTGNEAWWADGGRLTATATELGLNAIVIMPDGDDGFYVDWRSDVNREQCLAGARPFGREADMSTYCVETADYETYIVRDLVAHVDATYHTIADRSGRGIAGVSMGGFGALAVGMRNPDVFSAVASHSGVAALLYKGPRPYERGKTELFASVAEEIAAAGVFGPHFERIFGTDRENWLAHDPAHLADGLEPGQLDLYIDCGDQDQLRLQDGARYLHERLEARGIAHEFTIEDGGHDPAFFRSRIDDSLRFFQRAFSRRAASRQMMRRAASR